MDASITFELGWTEGYVTYFKSFRQFFETLFCCDVCLFYLEGVRVVKATFALFWNAKSTSVMELGFKHKNKLAIL